ncbi:MAG TPA: hypothetical protein VFP35_00725 [Candidatus Saccharimonadales bacterium]|nr:hypothetical protein [Candidatus Saccharimonadales bacterium]
MQTNLKEHVQVVLTFLGLGLLIFVIIFSHFKPRNQGVAAMGQNAVRTLIHSFTQKQTTTDSFNYVGLLPEVSVPAPARPSSQANPTNQTDNNQPAKTANTTVGSPVDSGSDNPKIAAVQTNLPAGADSASLVDLGVKPAPAHLGADLPDLKPLAPQPDSPSS